MENTEVKAQKIDSSTLDTLGIKIISFWIDDKVERFQFFEKTFFLANISIDLALRIFFLTLTNAEINFFVQKLS